MGKKSYSELITLPTYEERLEYLMLYGKVCDETFGGLRKLNQNLYKTIEWLTTRDKIIVRDMGCDLGIEDRPIQYNDTYLQNGLYVKNTNRIIVHHINPIKPEDILYNKSKLFDEENLICVSLDTHNIIHYGYDIKRNVIIERKPDDTLLWKRR